MLEKLLSIFWPSKGSLVVERSSYWPELRKKWIFSNPSCAVCGRTDTVEVHHIHPVHLFPERELDKENLITLCHGKDGGHHLLFGHLMNWKAWNPQVVLDATNWNEKILHRPVSANPIL